MSRFCRPQCEGVYSLKNETTQAIGSLQKAFVLDKSVIEESKTESAFDNIRESLEFQHVIIPSAEQIKPETDDADSFDF